MNLRLSSTLGTHSYSQKILDYYKDSTNAGQFEKGGKDVGTGLVGKVSCGDVIQLQLKVDEKTKKIKDAKYKAFGCGSAIASTAYAAEILKGKSIREAMNIKNTDIVSHLSLPPVKIHCSLLAQDAIKQAVLNYAKNNNVTVDSLT